MSEKLGISMDVVEHESRVTIALWRKGDAPEDAEKLDSASVGGNYLDIDANELRAAFEAAVVEKAEYIQDDD